MPLRLDSQKADFSAGFRGLLAIKREAAQDVEQAVRAIVAEVAAHGDKALLDLTAKFDRIDLARTGLRVTAPEIEAAAKACDGGALAALKVARDRIEAYHRRQRPSDERFTDALGVELGAKWTAIEAVGLYVPGGTAAYPSSVLMNAVPAKVAGVPRLAMVVPTPDGKLNPLVLAAAKLAGIDEIYRIGGAQAVAALAYGTETIAPVAKIVGPGNAYVAAAKRLVFGKVGIDMQPSHTQSGVDLIGVAGACGIGTCLDVRDENALADLAHRLKNLHETLFARVLIAAEEPPRVLPLRDGVALKERFRAAIGIRA